MLDEETEIRETTSYRPRLGLQTRISLFFAVGGLLVSIGLAGATLVPVSYTHLRAHATDS